MNKTLKKIIATFVLLSIPVFSSGYGYMGHLPELGKSSKPENLEQLEKKLELYKEKSKEKQLQPSRIIAPRPYSGTKINKYSAYLSDIKLVENMLVEIKAILEEKKHDKVQLFCAKVNLLNLYINMFKDKYGDAPERHYESYKQLIELDAYLKKIVDYKISMETYRPINRGTLQKKIEDDAYLNNEFNKALVPISTIIEILEEAS